MGHHRLAEGVVLWHCVGQTHESIGSSLCEHRWMVGRVVVLADTEYYSLCLSDDRCRMLGHLVQEFLVWQRSLSVTPQTSSAVVHLRSYFRDVLIPSSTSGSASIH